MKPRKTWRQKLADDKGLPKTGAIEGTMFKRWGAGTMVVPAPREVDAIMRRVPRGRLTTVQHIREELAKQHGVDIACPLTTGIFSWIAAHAAQEDEQECRKRFNPWWRTLKNGGEINPKYPGGLEGLRTRLEAEGHTVVARGKRWFVKDFEKVLVSPARLQGGG